jgi:NadR type nicotinamide-nucleotide adenylyltransferase
MIRIAITGPESSGKTTLAEALAVHFACPCILEFSRAYLMERGGNYTQSDLDAIAKGQLEMWRAKQGEDLVICDTEMLVMKVWSEFKYGTCSDFILNAVNDQKFDHYFLCRPDIAWEEDPLREHPEQREELFELYLNELISRQLPFTIVEGELQERIEKCIEVLRF